MADRDPERPAGPPDGGGTGNGSGSGGGGLDGETARLELGRTDRLDGETVRIDLGGTGRLDGETVRLHRAAAGVRGGDGPGTGPDRPGAAADELLGDEDGPVDLGAVRADDALLDLLGGSDPAAVSDDRLAELLVGWRREVDGRPLGELVDTDTALAVLARRRTRTDRRLRLAGPFTAAAAVLAITFSGVGLAARSAEPGDRLWGVAQVLYSGHTDSVEAAASVRTDLREVEDALAADDPDQARAALLRAQDQVAVVGDEHGRAELQTRVQQLTDELSEMAATAAPVVPSSTAAPVPSTVPSTAPARPLPPVDDPTEPTEPPPTVAPTVRPAPPPVEPTVPTVPPAPTVPTVPPPTPTAPATTVTGSPGSSGAGEEKPKRRSATPTPAG